jgi:hypothetical protein
MVSFMSEPEFDGQLERTLVAATRGCGDLGEAFAVAARIRGADVVAWTTEWMAAADKARAGADESLSSGDRASAAKGYLRSSEYYRQATFWNRTDLDDPALHLAYAAHVETFRVALKLLPYKATWMRVVTEDATGGPVIAQGYLLQPDDSAAARPTILAPAGYDSTAESGYGFIAVSALERGWNCLIFEGPGQGGVLFEDRLVLRPDYEAVVTPVVDWLVGQDGVDPRGLVLLGRSFAGYLAPRAAAADHRVTALVCDPAQFDFGAAVRHRLGEDRWRRLQDGDPTLDAELVAELMSTPLAKNGQQWRMVAHGAETVADMYRELRRFSLSGLADRITCPTLALAGEGDFAGTGQMQMFADAVQGPVTMHTFTAAEGAGGHCEGLGQDVFDQFLYGWLRQVSAGSLPTTGEVEHD